MLFTFIMVVPEVLPLWLDVIYAGDIHVPVDATDGISDRVIWSKCQAGHKELRGLLNQSYLPR